MNLLVSDSFRALLNVLRPNCPLPNSSNTIKNHLIEKSHTVIEAIKRELTLYKGFLTATIDLWTDSIMLHSYVGITLHFIVGSQFVYRCLGVIEIKGRHNFENIKKCVVDKLKIYGLTLDDIFAVITDNGSNIVKAFNDYQEG